MNWGNLDNFLAMGGYALYVWGSYGVAALCIALETFFLLKRSRAANREFEG